jgi:hypothetical protein
MNHKKNCQHRRRLKKKSLGDGADLNRRFLEVMKRHIDTRMDEARARYVKARHQGRFFFLRGGEVWPSNQADQPVATEKQQPSQTIALKQPHSPEEPQQPEVSAIDRILECAEALDRSKQIEQAMSDLTRLAQTGDQRIAAELHWIAVKAIVALNWLVMKKPEVLRPIARGEFCWPALIGRKRSIKQTNLRLIKTLELGEEEESAFSKRGWQMSAPSTQAAMDLFLTALSYEDDWELPPLTEKTKRTWFEVAWQQMLNDAIEPEKIPWLAQLGKSAIGKRSISRGMPAQTERMKRDDMRAEIKRQIWNAFDKLIVGASKKSK